MNPPAPTQAPQPVPHPARPPRSAVPIVIVAAVLLLTPTAGAAAAMALHLLAVACVLLALLLAVFVGELVWWRFHQAAPALAQWQPATRQAPLVASAPPVAVAAAAPLAIEAPTQQLHLHFHGLTADQIAAMPIPQVPRQLPSGPR